MSAVIALKLFMAQSPSLLAFKALLKEVVEVGKG